MHIGHRPMDAAKAAVVVVEGLELLAQDVPFAQDDPVEGAALVGLHVREARQGLGRGAQIGERCSQSLGGAAQQRVASRQLRHLGSDVGEGDDITAGLLALVEDQGHAAREQGARIRSRQHHRRRGVGLFLDRAVGQALERVQDRLAGDQVEQRAAEPQLARKVEDAKGGLVVEQDPVLEIADQHAFAQIAQQRFQPALLRLDPGGRLVDRAGDLAPGREQATDHAIDGFRQRAQGRVAGGIDQPVGPGLGDEGGLVG